MALVLVLAATLLAAAPALAAGKDCRAAPTGLVPLTDLGSGTYLGFEGGLYPDGNNEPPSNHLETGLALAEEVVPRNADGDPDPAGQIVFISIGVSNTLAHFGAFNDQVQADSEVNPQLRLVNGAQVGRALGQWASNNSDQTWNRLERNLRESGVTPAQVQVAWVMLPSKTRGPRTMEDAAEELPAFVRVMQEAKSRYPNLQLLYLSSRIYGGYIPDSDSEPNAYQHGFQMKWLIEDQIEGAAELEAGVRTPWMSWGPYLWADGTMPREDGLVWACDDLAGDGVHPSDLGAAKVGELLMAHFSADPTAVQWFLDSGEGTMTVTTATIPSTTAGSVPDPPSTTTGPARPADTRPERNENPRAAERVRAEPATSDWGLVAVSSLAGAALVSLGVALFLRRRPPGGS